MTWYIWYDIIYLLTAIGLTTGGSSTVNIYTQTIHRTTQSTQTIHRTTQFTNFGECGPCPVFARYTLVFALQLRKKHGKILSQGSRRLPFGKEYTEQSILVNKDIRVISLLLWLPWIQDPILSGFFRDISGFIGLERFCPGVKQNSVCDAKYLRHFRVVKNKTSFHDAWESLDCLMVGGNTSRRR